MLFENMEHQGNSSGVHRVARWYECSVFLVSLVSLICWFTMDARAGDTITACDRLAADPWDPQRVTDGVPDSDVEVEAALDACETCVEENPDNLRLRHQLGRVLRISRERQLRYSGNPGEYPSLREREIVDGLKKAAEAGYMPAQYEFACFCRDGFAVYGDDRNRTRIHDLYHQSAEQGYAPAQWYIGFRYAYGYTSWLTGAADFDKAIQWLTLAAEQGHTQAQANLGMIYDENELFDYKGAPEDFARARHWYLRAADRGHLSSKTRLGYLFMTGHGVERDCERAATLFAEVIEWCADHRTGETEARSSDYQALANSQALQRLGTMYLMGCGVERNSNKGASLIEQAAEQFPNTTAQAQIGYLYLEGRGVPKDPEEGYKWLKLAARNGNECAALDEVALAAAGHGTPRNPDWALYRLNQLLTMTQNPTIKRAANALARRIKKENPGAQDWISRERDRNDDGLGKVVLGIFILGWLFDGGNTAPSGGYLQGDGSQPYDNAVHCDNAVEIMHEAQMMNVI